MSFKGDLSTIGLAEVFQMISMSAKEGTLVVQDAESRKAIYFGKDGVQLHSAGKRKGFRIGDILVRAGKITVGQLREILEEQQTGSKRMIGEVLVERNMATEQEIQDIVKSQIEEEIYDLFLWRKANFEFIEGPPIEELQDPEVHAIRLAFDVNSLLLEAVRRTDEWTLINQKIPSMDAVYVYISDAAREEELSAASGPARVTAPLIDGQLAVNDVVEQSLVPRFEVCKIFVDLVDRGRIRLLTPAEFVALARHRLEEGRRDKGLKLFQVAAQLAPEDPELIGKYAHALETEGMIQEAARMYVKVGSLLKQQGQGKDALAYFQRAVSLNPDDLQSKVALFEINLATASVEEAVATANELVGNCLKEKNFDTAREIAEQAVAAAPQSLEMRLGLARTYHALGLKKERDEVVLFLRKNLPVDQEAADKIIAELRELSDHETEAPRVVIAGKRGRRKGRHGKLIRKGWLVVALLVLGGGGYFLVRYELGAREELRRLVSEAGELEKQLEWTKAVTKILSFKEGPYRHSFLTRWQMQDEANAVQTRMAAWERGRKAGPKGPKTVNVTQPAADKEKAQVELRNRTADVQAAFARQSWDEALVLAEQAMELAKQWDFTDQLNEIRRKYYDELFRQSQEIVRLKAEAERFEREGEYRKACEAVEAMHRFDAFWQSARDALFPLAIYARPAGVRIFKEGELKGESKDGPLVVYLPYGAPKFTLRFEKENYEPWTEQIVDERVGVVRVRLSSRIARDEWAFGAALAAAPMVANGQIYLLTEAGTQRKAYAMDPNRRSRWNESADTPPRAGPDGIVFFGVGSRVVGIDGSRADGQRRVWEFQAEDAVSTAVCFSGKKGALYFGCGRTLMAVDYARRELLWKKELPDDISAPAELDGRIFVACGDETLHAFGEGGASEWTTSVPLAPRETPAVAGGVLYVGGSDGRVRAIDSADGDVRWRSAAVPGKILASPAVQADLIYGATSDGWVFCVDASGSEKWRHRPGAGISAAAVAVNGVVLVGDSAGVFHCLDAASGEASWSYRTRGPIRTAAAVLNSRAYVGSEDKKIYVLPLD